MTFGTTLVYESTIMNTNLQGLSSENFRRISQIS